MKQGLLGFPFHFLPSTSVICDFLISFVENFCSLNLFFELHLLCQSVQTTLLSQLLIPNNSAFLCCFVRLWFACSFCADSLAVAAQTLIANSIALKDGLKAREVSSRVLQLGVYLGFVLAGVLAIGSNVLPKVFTSDPAVLAAISGIFPWVVMLQPVNALAFVWDGVLLGAKGFAYAAKGMVFCVAPAVGCMFLGRLLPVLAADQLQCIWLGFGVLMAMRSITIYLPYRLRISPFDRIPL